MMEPSTMRLKFTATIHNSRTDNSVTRRVGACSDLLSNEAIILVSPFSAATRVDWSAIQISRKALLPDEDLRATSTTIG